MRTFSSMQLYSRFSRHRSHDQDRRHLQTAEDPDIAAMERAALSDSSQIAADHPDCFQDWLIGKVSPIWLSQELDRCRYRGSWVDGAIGMAPPAIHLMERGHLYPEWSVLCRFAALVDRPIAEAFAPPPQGIDPRYKETGRFACRPDGPSMFLSRKFHPAIVSATVNHVGTLEDFADHWRHMLDKAAADAKAHGHALLNQLVETQPRAASTP